MHITTVVKDNCFDDARSPFICPLVFTPEQRTHLLSNYYEAVGLDLWGFSI